MPRWTLFGCLLVCLGCIDLPEIPAQPELGSPTITDTVQAPPDIAEAQPVLTVNATPETGGGGTHPAIALQIPPGATASSITVTVFEADPAGTLSGLSPELDAAASAVAAFRFEPNGTDFAEAAQVRVAVGEGTWPSALPVVVLERQGGGWVQATDLFGAPLRGRVVDGPAVEYPLFLLGEYAVARVPALLQPCVGEEAISCQDSDGDGVPDINDNCPAAEDPDQTDSDADSIGDGCDVCPGTPDPEQADGDENGVGDACDACWTGAGKVACDDGKPCNGVETCDLVAGCVPGEPPPGCCWTDSDCNDSNLCTGHETCDAASSTCAPGTPLVCDDGNICNGGETCAAATGCTPGAPLNCDDGNVCNGLESCDPTSGCVSAPVLDCNDNNACTSETCDPKLGCVTSLIDCADNDLCNGLESCNPAVGCTAGTTLVCNDGQPCNGIEACEPALGCVVGPAPAGCCTTHADCDDGSPCNGGGFCDPALGTCVVIPPLECDDGNPCNGTESCDPDLGCIGGAPPTCEDGNVCNGVATCAPDVGCVPGTPLVCVSDNLCSGVGWCHPTLGCQQAAAASCDDNNVCNGLEACDPETGCVPGVPLACDDGLTCNGGETCDPLTGCVPGDSAPPGCCTTQDHCDDNNPCNAQWSCDTQTGTCTMVAPPLSCSGGDVCTGLGYCDPSKGCVAISPLDCDDGNACNGAEACDPGTGCVSGPTPDCDDQNPCNGQETCSLSKGCEPGTPLICDDANICNGAETCSPTDGCLPGPPLQCNDGKPCNGLESCTETGGCVVGLPPPGCCLGDLDCDDGNVCNGTGTCDAGTCGVQAPPSCDDGAPCTDDACDPITGCTHTASAACGLTVLVTPADGGQASAQKSALAIEVPPGAVLVSITIAVDPLPDSEGVPLSGLELRSPHAFGPDSQQFLLPILVTLPLPPGVADGATLPILTRDDGGFWVTAKMLDGTPVTAVATLDPPSLVFFIDHFSDYGAGVDCQTCESCATGQDCDDANPCTTDSCTPAGCTHVPVDCSQGSGDVCVTWTCLPSAGCTVTPVDCDDGKACTADQCVPVQGCQSQPSPAACEDGDACTIGTCAPDGSCSQLPGTGQSCDDGHPCTPTSKCALGECVGAVNCDDWIECTVDTCDPQDGCEHELTDELCDDQNDCTIDTCDPLAKGCWFQKVGSFDNVPCDDGDGCTVNDTCKISGCGGTAKPCSDEDVCTKDSCTAGDCVHAPLDQGACDDADACSPDSTCQAGICTGVGAIGCDDQKVCTADSCSPAAGCVYDPIAGCLDTDNDQTPDADDCGPNDPEVHPGAPELCNGQDDNCDESLDEGACTSSEPCVDPGACAAGLVCLPASAGGATFCAAAATDCVRARFDGLAEVTPDGAQGCISDTQRATCDAGTLVDGPACEEPTPGCAAGACGVCVPGEKACDGDKTVVQCAADASGFVPVGDCPLWQSCMQDGACVLTDSMIGGLEMGGDHRSPHLAVGPDEIITVVWQDKGEKRVLMRRMTDLGTPDPASPDPVIVHTEYGTLPRVAVSAGNYTMVVWKDGARIYSPLGVAGPVFDPLSGEAVASQGFTAGIEVVEMAEDRFAVVYLLDGQDHTARVRIFEHDGTLDSQGLIVDDTAMTRNPVVAATADGGFVTAWMRNSGLNMGASYLKVSPEGAWSNNPGPLCYGYVYGWIGCASMTDGGWLCTCYVDAFEPSRFSATGQPISAEGLAPTHPTPHDNTALPFPVKNGIGLKYVAGWKTNILETFDAQMQPEGYTSQGLTSTDPAIACVGLQRGHVACSHMSKGPNDESPFYSWHIKLRFIARPQQ